MNNIISMFSSHATGMWEYEIAADRFSFINDYFQILNLNAAEIKFSNRSELLNFIHSEDLEAYQKSLDAAIDTKSKDISVTYRMVGKDNSVFWLEDHFFFVEKTAASPEKIIAYTTSAEAIKVQEAKVEESEARYRQLVNILFPDFIFVFDENFNFIDIILPDGLRLFHKNEEVIGTSGRSLYSPEVSNLFEANIKESLDTGKVKEIEYHLDLFGTRYYYQARLVPISGRKIFTLIRDIGDRVRRMEDLLESRRKAQEADKLKSAFLANMSHEIRTPLNAIIGFTEIIVSGEEQDPGMIKKYMEIVHSNNGLLLQLINDILDLSRLESGRTEIVLKKTNMNELIQETYKTQKQSLMINENIEFNVLAPEEEIWVYTDPNRVKQVLFNFLSNAAKNTEEGSITLSIAVEGNHLNFAVKDTGKGIPSDKLQHIFNRFEKLDIFTQGTGLGLSIAKGIVDRLGGQINVESEVGVGSTFSFTIPYKDSRLMSERKIGRVKELFEQQRKRILVGEVSEDNFKVINEVLSNRYDLLWVKDGEEVVNSFILENPDLVLLSIQLPVLSGIDAIKKIRSISQNIPIIGVTSNDFYVEQKWAVESGCDDVISKPYSAIKLEEVITVFI